MAMLHEIKRRRGDPQWTDRFLAALAGGVPPSEPELRDQVLSLLLRWRGGLIAGSVCSMVVWISAWILLGSGWPIAFVAAELWLCAAKWSLANDRSMVDAPSRARGVGRLMLLSVAWALLLGVGIGLCIASGNAGLTTVAVGVGAGSIGVATFRNAPTPRNARLVILCVVVPPAISAFFMTSGPLSLLGLFLVPWCISLFMMVGQNFEVMKQASSIRIEMHRIAHTDALTGLENRLAFNELFRGAVIGSGAFPATLLYLDLDNFKQVNDAHGHEAGDRLLVEVSHRIRCAVRGCDRVFRLGGDEFAILLDAMPPGDVESRVSEMIAAISEPVTVMPGVTATVGASVGIAQLSGPGGTRSLLREADAALYRAKAEGRGRYVRAARA